MNTLGMIAIVIDDYDAAISHYVNDLGFDLIEDNVMSPEKRRFCWQRLQRISKELR